MTYLVDINVWVALSTPGHVHHAAATAWFDSFNQGLLLFCRVTQMGFLRLITNARVMEESVLTSEKAWQVVDALLKDDRIRYAVEPLDLETSWRDQTRAHKTGSNFWTDAYLAAFAVASNSTLVTFDKGFTTRKDVSVRLLG